MNPIIEDYKSKTLQGFDPKSLKDLGDLEWYNTCFTMLYDSTKFAYSNTNRQLDEKDNQIKNYKKYIDNLHDNITNKDNKIEELEKELWKLKVI